MAMLCPILILIASYVQNLIGAESGEMKPDDAKEEIGLGDAWKTESIDDKICLPYLPISSWSCFLVQLLSRSSIDKWFWSMGIFIWYPSWRYSVFVCTHSWILTCTFVRGIADEGDTEDAVQLLHRAAAHCWRAFWVDLGVFICSAFWLFKVANSIAIL